MFTARCEYRLLLRADNADMRLTAKAHTRAGLVTPERLGRFLKKRELVAKTHDALAGFTLTGAQWQTATGLVVTDSVRRSAIDVLASGQVGWDSVAAALPAEVLAGVPKDVQYQVEVEASYSPAIKRQIAEVKRMRVDHVVHVPRDMDYADVASLSNEEREKLATRRPATIGEAAAIPGVTPSGVLSLLQWIRRARKNSVEAAEEKAKEQEKVAFFKAKKEEAKKLAAATAPVEVVPDLSASANEGVNKVSTSA